MLEFLLYTIVFWFAGVCFSRLANISVQEGQWFDLVFDWQNRLNKWYNSDKWYHLFLFKAGGGCAQCFSWWITNIWYLFYVIFMIQVLNVWITDNVNLLLWKILVNIIWYFAFNSVGAVLSLIFIQLKMRRRE